MKKQKITIISGTYQDYPAIMTDGKIFVEICGKLSPLHQKPSYKLDGAIFLNDKDKEKSALKKVESVKHAVDFGCVELVGYTTKGDIPEIGEKIVLDNEITTWKGDSRIKSTKVSIVNCTPHPITIKTVEKETTFQPSGILPRVAVVQDQAQPISGFTCVTSKTGEVEGLPESEQNTFYIVSGMVFGATNRKDLIAPDTGKTASRNEKGHIIAVTRFLRK